MSQRTRISFRNIEPSDEIVGLVAEKTTKLRRISPNLITSQITLEQPHSNHTTGNECAVVLRVGLPGATLVGRAVEKGAIEDRLPVAVAEVFRSVERQILARESRQEHRRRLGLRAHRGRASSPEVAA